MLRLTCPLTVLTLGFALAHAGAPAVKSGPQPGTTVPGPFDAFVINSKFEGKVVKERQHCLVCQNGLHPAVLIFAREPAAGKEGPLNELLKKLDESLEAHKRSYLGGYAVFLSPDARGSVTGEGSDDVEKLLDEATKRLALFKRLEERAKPFEKLVFACYPDDGPKGYQVNPKAAVTVILYQRLKVLANWAYEDDQLTEEGISGIVKKLDATLADGGKKKKM